MPNKGNLEKRSRLPRQTIFRISPLGVINSFDDSILSSTTIGEMCLVFMKEIKLSLIGLVMESDRVINTKKVIINDFLEVVFWKKLKMNSINREIIPAKIPDFDLVKRRQINKIVEIK